MPRTADGSPSLNMFGIKAGEEWSGARAVADTVEFSGGVATHGARRFAPTARSRKASATSPICCELAALSRRDCAGGDAQAYIRSIAKSGYATDPDYGE
jgi:flagellar protein FlgJ